MKNWITILLGLMGCVPVFGQTLTERLILTDSKDSLFLSARKTAFDRNGNYCFVVKKNGLEYFVTNKDTIGETKFMGSTFGNGGEIYYTHSDLYSKDEPFYYKNAHGTKVYGTAIGKIQYYETSNTTENVAIVTKFKDSLHYYINGKLLLKKLSTKKFNATENWASFSENGNVIYTLDRGNLYHLYVNGKPIDSSKFSYNQFAINNDGDYIYAKGEKPEQPIGKYDYMFFIHTKDTVTGPVRTVWNYGLRDNGTYYYSGDDNGPYYIAINNRLYKDIAHISNITLIDRKTYLYTFEEKGVKKMNVNGNMYTHDFDEIYFPTLDTKGNFAFYGMKDYYLYKFVNGKKVPDPISKYDVRPTPLYISPKGESLHFFKTDDFIYLYQDEKLLFDPIPKDTTFFTKLYEDFLPSNYFRDKATNGNVLFYIEYGNQGYYVFNGKLSRPILPIKEKSYSKKDENGAIVAGLFNDNGFFAIQKTDEKKFIITINNTTYKEINGVDYIIPESYFFDGKQLIFYGVKDFSFYQFTMSL